MAEQAEPLTARLVGTALRCYPAQWRRRHGAEAAELAGLLIRDGTPAGSIAVSYLAGAAREWLAPRLGRPRRLIMVACALLAAACSLSVCAALLDTAVPARAASTSHARGRAHCRPGSPEPVPGVTPATIAREAGHDRAC